MRFPGEDRCEQQRRYRQRHPEKTKSINDAWVEKNRERVRENKLRWNAANKAIRKEYKRRYHAKYPETSKSIRLIKKYGITIKSKNSLIAGQGASCGWCLSANPGSKQGWALDHDHDTGVIRGILCLRCNTGIEHYVANGGQEHDPRVRAYLSCEKLAAVTVTLLISEFLSEGPRWRQGT